MAPKLPDFQKSVDEQIRLNLSRTPTERFLALCDLLDAARAIAPKGPQARAQRLAALQEKQKERQRLREFLRQHIQQHG